MLIGLTQQTTRCSDSSCQAQEDLIAGFSAIEAEAELVQIGLKLCAATVICAKQKCFQVADGFVQPTQVARFILFRVQLHARQVLIASVAVAFDFCTCRNHVCRCALLRPRSRRPSQRCRKVRISRLFEPSRDEFCAKDTTPTHSRCSACDSAEQRKCRVCPWHTDRSPRTRPSTADVCGA